MLDEPDYSIYEVLLDPIKNMWNLREVYEMELDRWVGTKPFGEQHELFNPSPEMFKRSVLVYKYHLTELIERVKTGTSLTFATKAEVMLILSNTSLATMLNRDGNALYCKLFKECFGKLPASKEPEPTELYENSAQEMLISMQKRYRKEHRKWAI